MNIPDDSVPTEVYKIQENNTEYTPHIVEPSIGIDRWMLAMLYQNYMYRKNKPILNLPTKMAIYDYAVFCLLQRDDLQQLANNIQRVLDDKYKIYIDNSSCSIGKKYLRADLLGVQKCITVDIQSLTDNCITVRDLLTTNQERINIKDLPC